MVMKSEVICAREAEHCVELLTRQQDDEQWDVSRNQLRSFLIELLNRISGLVVRTSGVGQH